MGIEFIKIDDDNGCYPKYLLKSSVGEEEIETYREDLYSYIRRFISRFENLTYAIGDDAFNEFGAAFDALVRDSLRQLELTCAVIEKEIGKIYIDQMPKNRPNYYRDDPIGAIIKPKS